MVLHICETNSRVHGGNSALSTSPYTGWMFRALELLCSPAQHPLHTHTHTRNQSLFLTFCFVFHFSFILYHCFIPYLHFWISTPVWYLYKGCVLRNSVSQQWDFWFHCFATVKTKIFYRCTLMTPAMQILYPRRKSSTDGHGRAYQPTLERGERLRTFQNKICIS
jgi:hypothetical protein